MEVTSPHTVDDVFDDFKGRRTGLIKALTDDADKFFEKCDPEKENLCLVGYPNGSWDVTPPDEMVPPDLPEPVLGINYKRDSMQKEEWLSHVADCSYPWLLSVAFYFSSRFGFGRSERSRLFDMMNELPTVYEAMSGEVKQPQDESGNHNSSKSKPSKETLPCQSEQPESKKMSALSKEDDESYGKGEDEETDSICGACGIIYVVGEFWIYCERCERWFHGKCVRITPAKAKLIKDYICRSCRNNRKARV